MPVFARYDFNDPNSPAHEGGLPTAHDSALENGAQDGVYMHGAHPDGGQGQLDGIDDMIKIFANPTFQMQRGTLDIAFTRTQDLTEPRTILSRDTQGMTDGGYRIESLPDGTIRITHESPSGAQVYQTAAGFQATGDLIHVTYSWDAATGGQLDITNSTKATAFHAPVPAGLTMDMGAQSQHWVIGAGQTENTAGTVDHVGDHYPAKVDYFQLSDTVDNKVTPPVDPKPDGIVEGTAAGDLIDYSYSGDPNGDFVDNNDALLRGEAPQDDIIYGYGGRDTIIAGEGDDDIFGGHGADLVYGGIGDDIIRGEQGKDTLHGGQGDDAVSGGRGDDLIFGDDGDDKLNGDRGDDEIHGDAGQDSINGGSGADTLFGGAGDDSLRGGDGADAIDGGAGDDTIYGGWGDDVLIGGAGNDYIDGGRGNDFIDTRGPGASSPDRAFPDLYAADGDPMDDRDTVYGGRGHDTIFTGDDQDVIKSGRGQDFVDAGDDDDYVHGGAASDTLIGGEGADTIDGGRGNDLIYGDSRNPDADPTHLLDSDGDPDPDNNRDLLMGGMGKDTIYGGDDADTIFGGRGADLLYGGIDNDRIFGGMGNDTIYGGGDADHMVGGGDRDTFIDVGPGSFVDGSENGNDFDTLDLRNQGRVTVLYDDDNPENGIVEYFHDNGDSRGTTRFINIERVILPDGGAPLANPDVATTPEDTTISIHVTGNDTDPDGQPLTVTEARAEHGTVTIGRNGHVTYRPEQNFNGTDTITYTVTDPDGNISTSTVTVTVTPVNDAPEAMDDFAATPRDTPVIIEVLANDTDLDGDPLTILGQPVSDHGTVVVNPDGTITFTPEPGFTGTAEITYQIDDGNGGTDDAVVRVQVGDPDGRDGIVRGTDGDDLIDHRYVDPWDGDVVDGNDAIIRGDGPNDDRIIAGAGNDTILAGDGRDTIEAGAGDDLVYGGRGDETIYGGDGRDSIFGGGGRELIYGGDGDDLIDTRTGIPLPDIDYPGLYPADGDIYNNRDTVYGGNGNDTIFTGDDADRIYGGNGNDYIDGGFDDDTIDGGDGDDTIIGSEGNDSIHGGGGNDLIFGGLDLGYPDSVNIRDDQGDLRPNNNADHIHGWYGDDTIYGMDDNDTLDGGMGNDLLYGGVDNDLLLGAEDNDTLYGGQGADTLYGGSGNDVLHLGDENGVPDSDADVAYGDQDRDTFTGVGAGDTVYGGADGDDWDTLDLRGLGPHRVVQTGPDSDGNGFDGYIEYLDGDGNVTGRADFYNIEEIVDRVVCFTPGTMIATPKGEVPVESLRHGDKVITRDNGLQEIRWIGKRDLGWQDLRANPHLQPVLVKAGSLGHGLPERDMMLSPNHRVLLTGGRNRLYFDEHEVLVAAKHLVGLPGVQTAESQGTSYIHFMCDQHEVVLSNGAWTESFQPGDHSLQGLVDEQRDELFELFPDLRDPEGVESYIAARKTLKRHEARLLLK